MTKPQPPLHKVTANSTHRLDYIKVPSCVMVINAVLLYHHWQIHNSFKLTNLQCDYPINME